MSLEGLWSRVVDWFADRSERSRLVSGFNSAARNAFVSGNAPTLLKAKISSGDAAYRHQFSRMNSGFRIQALSGRMLTKSELMHIGSVILNDDLLIRKLIVLGWDTLEIHGDIGTYGCKWQLRDRLSLGPGTSPVQLA